jgi:hypothetical protein
MLLADKTAFEFYQAIHDARHCVSDVGQAEADAWRVSAPQHCPFENKPRSFNA